jgi:hypothetical protein
VTSDGLLQVTLRGIHHVDRHHPKETPEEKAAREKREKEAQEKYEKEYKEKW